MKSFIHVVLKHHVNLCNGVKITYETEMQKEENKTKHKKTKKQNNERKKKG